MEYDKQYKTSLDEPLAEKGRQGRAMRVLGGIIAVIGFLILFERYYPVYRLLHYWPFLLILTGGIMIWKSSNRS